MFYHIYLRCYVVLELKVKPFDPEFAGKLMRMNADYNKECDEIDNLEKEGRIFVIAPSEHVTVKRVESNMNKLGNLYWLGYNDAKNNLFSLNKYLK